METIRKLIAVALGLVGLTALFSSEEFAGLFLGLSPDNQVHSYSWLQLEIALGGLLGPAVVLFAWPQVYAGLRRLVAWLDTLRSLPFWAGAIALGVLVRLIVILLFDPHLVSDAAEYDRLGWTLTTTGCYCEAGVATAYRAPGYPFFLSLIYQLIDHTPTLIPWFQLLFGPLIAWLSFLLARRSRVEKATARLVAVVLMLFPGLALYTNPLLSELLFTTILLAAVYLVLSRAWWQVLIGGILLGAAVLTRPLGVIVLPMLLLYFLLVRRNQVKALVTWGYVLAGVLLVCLPWLSRNDREVGRFTVATSGGVNFYIGNHEGASFGYQTPDPLLFRLDDPAHEAFHDWLGYELGWRDIKQRPVAFLKRAVAKVVYLYVYDADPLREDLLKAEYVPGLAIMALAIFTQAWYLVFLLLVGNGLLQWLRDRQPVVLWMPVLLLVGFSLVHAVYFAAGRFHVPLIPFLCLFLWPVLRPDLSNSPDA